MRRKFAISALFFVGGILITYNLYHAFSIKTLGIILIVSLGAFLTGYVKKLSLAFLTLGIISMVFSSLLIDLNPVNKYVDKTIQGNFTVESVSPGKDGSWDLLCTLKGLGSGAKPSLRGKVLLNYRGHLEDPPSLTGSRLVAVTKLKVPETSPVPGELDYRRYLYSRGIHYTGKVTDLSHLTPSKDLVSRAKVFLLGRKEAFLRKLSQNPDRSAFFRGILFGDTSAMEDDFKKAFQDNGTAHILAVSGLHIGILYGIFKALSKKTNHPAVTVLFVLFLLVYGTLTLWTVSVRRASALIAMKLLADRLDLRFDMTTALAFVAFVILLSNPFALFNTGFQLSFLAVLSIIFLCPLTTSLFGDVLGMAIGVQLGISPYIIYAFNKVSLLSIAVNIPIVYLAAVIVPPAIGAFCLFAATGFLPHFLTVALESLSSLIIYVNDAFHQGGRFCLNLPSPGLGLLILIYVLLFFAFSEEAKILFLRKEKKKIALILIFFLTLSVATAVTTRNPIECMPLKILQLSDITAVETDGRLYYFTSGDLHPEDADRAEKKLKSYIYKNGIKEAVDLSKKGRVHDGQVTIHEASPGCYTLVFGKTSIALGKVTASSKERYKVSTAKVFKGRSQRDGIIYLTQVKALGVSRDGEIFLPFQKPKVAASAATSCIIRLFL